MEASYELVQENVDFIGKIYTNLTSILLEYGYEYILEHLDKSEDVKCIDETLNILYLLESEMGREHKNELKSPPRMPAPRMPTHRKSMPTANPKVWDFMTRLGTNKTDVVGRRLPLIRFRENPDSLIDYYSKIAAKVDNQVAREFQRAPKGQQLEVLDMRKRLLNKHVENALQSTLKEKVQQRLSQNPTPTRFQRPANEQLNQSINIEDLHLEI